MFNNLDIFFYEITSYIFSRQNLTQKGLKTEIKR